MFEKASHEAARCRVFMSMMQAIGNLGIGLDQSIDLARRFTDEALAVETVAAEELRGDWSQANIARVE